MTTAAKAKTRTTGMSVFHSYTKKSVRNREYIQKLRELLPNDPFELNIIISEGAVQELIYLPKERHDIFKLIQDHVNHQFEFEVDDKNVIQRVIHWS